MCTQVRPMRRRTGIDHPPRKDRRRPPPVSATVARPSSEKNGMRVSLPTSSQEPSSLTGPDDSGDDLLGHRLTATETAGGSRETSSASGTAYPIESVRDDALAAGLMSPADWDRGIADLHLTGQDGGTFCYTFFKAVALNPPLVTQP